MIETIMLLSTAALLTPDGAPDLTGPGRFCGAAPIIDLLPGETITTREIGIHSGSFRWTGEFGAFEVRGIGWASQPKGHLIREPTAAQPGRFKQRRDKGRFVVAIWNGGHGAAYFTSERPFSAAQIAAIDRVTLFEEGQSPPEGCTLRTTFSWD